MFIKLLFTNAARDCADREIAPIAVTRIVVFFASIPSGSSLVIAFSPAGDNFLAIPAGRFRFASRVDDTTRRPTAARARGRGRKIRAADNGPGMYTCNRAAH